MSLEDGSTFSLETEGRQNNLSGCVTTINTRDIATIVLLKIARFATRGSGDIEKIYYSIDQLGFLWLIVMRVMTLLKVDQEILAPAGSKLVPIPLLMSSSEREVLNIFKPKLGEIVVDVGTYYGRYTLLASKYVGDGGLVVGIEADFDNYCIVKKNVEMAKAKNVLLIWSAASNQEGTIKLYKTERPGTPSIVWDARTRHVTVQCKTIDSLLQESNVAKVDWLKIDVEGAELMVLEGCKKTIAENERLKLLIEIHTPSNEVHRFLKELGYQITYLEQKEQIPYHILASKSQ